MPHTAEPDAVSLSEVLPGIWGLLERGVSDRRHGFHHPVLATIGLEGRPKSRIVILRSAQPEPGVLRFHTDVRSGKCQELAQNPSVCLTFYDEEARVQVIAEGTAVLHAGDRIASVAWSGSQRMSKAGYCTTPAPATVIDDAGGYHFPDIKDDFEQGYLNFGAVVIHVTSFDWLFLRAGGLRRARFDLANSKAQWLVP